MSADNKTSWLASRRLAKVDFVRGSVQGCDALAAREKFDVTRKGEMFKQLTNAVASVDKAGAALREFGKESPECRRMETAITAKARANDAAKAASKLARDAAIAAANVEPAETVVALEPDDIS